MVPLINMERLKGCISMFHVMSFLFGQKVLISFSYSFKMTNEIWFMTPLSSSGVFLLFGLNKFLTGFNLLVFSVVTFSDPLWLIKSVQRAEP